MAVATAALTAVIATLAGYGFGRFRFRGSGVAFGLVLLAFMIPFQAVLTPLFLELHDFGLLNSLVGLALFYTAFNLPFGTYLMRNTFLQIPSELTDAAKVDGASVMTTLTRVLRPADHPGRRDHDPLRLPVLVDGVPRRADVHDARTRSTRCPWRS